MISLLLFAFVVAAMFLLQTIQLVLGTGGLVATDALRPQLACASGISTQVDGCSRRPALSNAIPEMDGTRERRFRVALILLLSCVAAGLSIECASVAS